MPPSFCAQRPLRLPQNLPKCHPRGRAQHVRLRSYPRGRAQRARLPPHRLQSHPRGRAQRARLPPHHRQRRDRDWNGRPLPAGGRDHGWNGRHPQPQLWFLLR